MAKTRSAEKAAQDAEDRTDGLEIVSIGSLYKGSWDKKYWTTSRGKDRYPYPVGYQAVRAYNGTTYKMEICEGVNGPRFLISSDDGSSSSGKTADQAWEEFQKKGCPRIKIWHGKRLSSKMDGLELFGFKNQFIQRLLRELVTDVNGIAEQSLVSPNVCDRVTTTDHDNCCPNVGTYPDLLLCLRKPHVTRKRSRCELKNKKLNVRAGPQSPDFSCSRRSIVKNEKSLGQGSSTICYGSEVVEVHNQIGVPPLLERISSVCKSSDCISSKNDLLLNPIEISDDKKVGAVPSKGWTGFLYSENCKTTELTENMSTEELSHDVELKKSNLLVTSEDKRLMQSCSKESVGCIDFDLCAPDTLDFVQENTPNSAPSELDKNPNNETACEINSEDLLNAEHEEVLKCNSNPSYEKSDFGSAGQDVAKSMMALLLPQAVPLLRTVSISTDKEFTDSPSDMLPSQVKSQDEQNFFGYNVGVSSSASVIVTEAAHRVQGEKIHGCTDSQSNTPKFEHMKSIVPDSFEYSQCDDYKANQETSDNVEPGRSCFNKEMCSQQLLDHDLPNGTSTCHSLGLDFKDRPQNCDVCIPESVLDDIPTKDLIISERSDDACTDVKENIAHVFLSSVQKDLLTAQDFTGASVIMTEAAHREQGEKIHGCTDSQSNTPKFEHMKSIVPDSFEYSQCYDYKANQETYDNVEPGRSCFNKEMCSQQLLGHDLPNGTSTCHALGLDFKDRPQNCDVCIPESVLDDIPTKDLIISERSDDACTDVKENTAHVFLSSVQKDLLTAQDFTGGVNTKSWQLESTETLAEKIQDDVVGQTGNAEMMIMPSKLPKLVYTRKKLQNAIPFQENCSVYTTKDTLHPSETILINNVNDKPCESDDTTGLCVQTPQICSDVQGGHGNLVAPDPTSSQNLTLFADENKCFVTKEAQLISEPMALQNLELKNNLGSSVKFVGRYLHPMPVSSLFLSTSGDEIHVCVLCGHLPGQYRTLFTYKVAFAEATLGCPSVMSHSSILLPDPKHNFIKETMVERSGVQLTPGGQYIVLIGSIKTPNCREGKIDCHCSTCTSVCSEKNALKIVQVEHGYVSVITTLETVDNVHCILVCEPNRLVSVGESGKLQVWVMNSKWSEKIEYFIIPADGSVSPGIVELKRVPKCTHLVVGHNSCGEFSLWDIAKCNCVTSFSALKSPINEFFPISLFEWQTKGSGFSNAGIEEQADKLLEATNLWYSEQRDICWFSPLEEEVAMWLFVSTTTDLDCCHNVSTSSSYDIHTNRSWRLALLMKNSITIGSPLDLRTSVNGVFCGYGIISTSDGVVYMWELSKGSKLDTLHHFQDGNVTCVATDDSRGALGVAGGRGELLLYLHLPELDSN